MTLAISIASLCSPDLISSSLSKHNNAPLPPFFFDAETTHFNRQGTQQIFEGNVVLMVGANLIWADSIHVDREKEFLKAIGHVLVVNAQQVFGGDEVTFYFKSEDFFLKNAFVISDDKAKADEISKKILGISPQEVKMELEKNRQLQKLQEKKEALKKNFEGLAPSQKEFMIDEFALLLEKEKLISEQTNPVLAQISEHQREAIQKRREFWEQSQKSKLPMGRPLLTKSYIRLDGAWIERTEGNHYRANKVTVTPCRCDEDEKAAWQVRADTLDAYGEGYADFEDAVIEVKGIPVLYLPYLRLPMKGERQSGFLFPSLSYNRFNGSIFSQPVFFDLGANKDSTMTVDFMEKRGVRLGGEFRYQQKTYSGWELQGEAIRDRQWTLLQSQRAEISRSYWDGLQQAAAQENNTSAPSHSRYTKYTSGMLSTPDFWRSNNLSYCLQNPSSPLCREIIDAYVEAPANPYRYKSEWKGMTFFTPRVSVVSEGKILSDHRYLQDLYFERFNESFNPASPDLFSKTKGQLHLDGNDFYAGLGSSWGDNLTVDSRYSGHQIPASIRLRSRTFELFEEPRPVYGSLLLNYKRIQYFDDSIFLKKPPSNDLTLRLDSGDWSQVKFNIFSPLLSNQAVNLNYFTELESRFVNTEYRFTQGIVSADSLNENPHTTLRTLRYGLDLQLPIDGTMQLSPSHTAKSEGLLFLNHRMNWGLTYSIRPSVVRQGPYGDLSNLYAYNAVSSSLSSVQSPSTQRLTYFLSESPDNFDSDALPEQERMIPHHQVLFSTSHDWVTYKKNWYNTLAPSNGMGSQDLSRLSFRERARNELEYSSYLMGILDSQLTEQELEQKGFQFSEGERTTVAHVDGNISYDFKKAANFRKNQGQITSANSSLQPWSPARANANVKLANWTLSNFTKYDIYLKLVTGLSFQLSTPTFYSTKLNFGYSIDKELRDQNTGGISVNRTLTQSQSLTSSLIPYITLLAEYNIRIKEHETPSRFYYLSYGASYASPSNCWGLQFFWKKDYADPWSGTYFLSLIVKFFNYNREYGNFLARANANQN